MLLRYSTVFSSLFIAFTTSLKCYEGSRGVVNGEEATNFVVNQCDENMQFCFESYNSNLTEVTASCQSMGTDPKLLDVCKMDGKCRERNDIDVTVCCCTDNLCNLQDDLKPTPEEPVNSSENNHNNNALPINPRIDRLVEINDTLTSNGSSNDTFGL